MANVAQSGSPGGFGAAKGSPGGQVTHGSGGGGTYTDAQGRQISAQEAQQQGRIDKPGEAQSKAASIGIILTSPGGSVGSGGSQPFQQSAQAAREREQAAYSHPIQQQVPTQQQQQVRSQTLEEKLGFAPSQRPTVLNQEIRPGNITISGDVIRGMKSYYDVELLGNVVRKELKPTSREGVLGEIKPQKGMLYKSDILGFTTLKGVSPYQSKEFAGKEVSVSGIKLQRATELAAFTPFAVGKVGAGIVKPGLIKASEIMKEPPPLSVFKEAQIRGGQGVKRMLASEEARLYVDPWAGKPTMRQSAIAKGAEWKRGEITTPKFQEPQGASTISGVQRLLTVQETKPVEVSKQITKQIQNLTTPVIPITSQIQRSKYADITVQVPSIVQAQRSIVSPQQINTQIQRQYTPTASTPAYLMRQASAISPIQRMKDIQISRADIITTTDLMQGLKMAQKSVLTVPTIPITLPRLSAQRGKAKPKGTRGYLKTYSLGGSENIFAQVKAASKRMNKQLKKAKR